MGNLSLAATRQLLPMCKGCLIQDYPSRKSYQVYCSASDHYPRSKCFNFNTVWTEEQCLTACLKWSWMKHLEKTGLECPHTFADGDVSPPF